MSEEKLRQFEQKADELASRLVVLNDSPYLLHQVFLRIDYLIDNDMKREAGDLCSRISYLPRLLDNYIDESSQQIDLLQYSFDLENLLQYLHFCELMPQFHKDYYQVSGNEVDGFHLHHKQESFSKYEIQDVLMAELARPFCREKPGQLIQPLLEIISKDPKLFKFPAHLMENLIRFYQDNLYDLFEIPDSVYRRTIKCTAQEFMTIRNYLFALSEFQMNMLACAKIFRALPADKYVEDTIERSVFCFMPGHNLLDEARKYTGIGKNKILNSLRPFILDLTSSTAHKKNRNKHSGDGYFPPIVKVDDGYFLPPMAIKSFICNRNLLFAFQKQDSHRFNSMISKSFEPSLITWIVRDLSILNGIEVRLNHVWSASSSSGEIDILIYSYKLNKVVIIQVKAVIPPQGARMVRNVQSRILEGIEQITRFRKILLSEKDRIISDSIGFQVSSLDFEDVILSSSCFGSAETWSELESQNICGINHLLFKLLVFEANQTKNADLLFDISSWTKEKIANLMHESNLRWEEREFELFGTKIHFPSWSIDEKPLNTIRNQILEAKAA